MKGIEPSYVAWEATVLPLNYTRGCVANSEPLRRLDSVRVTFLDRDARRTSGGLWAPREAHSPGGSPWALQGFTTLYNATPAGLFRPACAGFEPCRRFSRLEGKQRDEDDRFGTRTLSLIRHQGKFGVFSVL